MSVTLTYKMLAFAKGIALIGFMALLMAGLTMPVAAQQEAPGLGYSKLAPPKSKFRLPRLGDIAIWRNDMQKAKRAYRKGNYSKARKYLHKALKNKNFIAAWYLGHIHRLGLGVPQNAGEAFRFYRIVALEYDDQGLPPRVFRIALDSLVRVANGYRAGIKSIGVKRDYRRAMRLYSKAANRGHPAAQYGMADMFLKGQSVKQNPRKAVRWIRLAARKRFPPALAQLAEFSVQGKYVRKSMIRAVAMYIVATNGTNEALHPHIFDRLDMLSRKLTDAQYRQAQELARRWLKRNRAFQPTAGRQLRILRQRKQRQKENPLRNLYRSVVQPFTAPAN